ncbi:fumarylacetoacetate hydrolase family protein, partial [Rhodopseudomonas sp. B29]|uniref:fumarylacetoacetate hydrolase family protein n=1 Tax=Rhodopseudomonas sp. B29 TaxID=95607 RepID=UPI0004CEF8A8
DARDQANGGIDVELDVSLSTSLMRQAGHKAAPILRSNAQNLYWTPAQMIAHHTVNGCNLEPGDLIGTGTISGPNAGELGSMLELTAAGSKPLVLGSGEERGFLQDGDIVSFSGRCRRPGYASIGFGQCTGTVAAARETIF